MQPGSDKRSTGSSPKEVDGPPSTQPPLRVGLVGAGLWAEIVHAPMLAGGPETELVGVWARRFDAAARIAAAHGTHAFDDYGALLDHCDAVTFSVPPDVQATMATRAAQAGKAVMLEKPIALDEPSAERLTDAVNDAGVASIVVLTWRYATRTRAFLKRLPLIRPIGGSGRFISAASLGGPFATPWRLERGPLFDLGPHVIDMLEASLGRVVSVHASGTADTWVALLLGHENGPTSAALLSASVPGEPGIAGVEIFGHDGVEVLDASSVAESSTFACLRREFTESYHRRAAHALDVNHGLHLQRLITEADTQLRGATPRSD